MKKLFYILLMFLVGIGLLYLVQPYLGFNISISEVLGRSFPFLKPQAYHDIDLKNDFILKPYVQHLDSPRFMYVTESGDLLVTEPPKGNLLLIPYKKPNQKRVLLSGLNNPHSMDVYENYLYVAEENAIGRIKYDAKDGRTIGRYERIIKNIPDDGGH
ncbi:TPA: hypothetical protein ACTXXA_002568 [Legionella anisa]